MDKLKAIWAKYRALPWYWQDGVALAAGVLLGRLGAPWLF